MNDIEISEFAIRYGSVRTCLGELRNERESGKIPNLVMKVAGAMDDFERVFPRFRYQIRFPSIYENLDQIAGEILKRDRAAR